MLLVYPLIIARSCSLHYDTKYEATGLCVFAATEYLMALVMPCNAWLFLLRVRAIPRYSESRIMPAICTLLWVATFSAFPMLPISRSTAPSNAGCVNGILIDNGLISVPFIALAIFDTSVTIVIFIGMMDRNPNVPLATRVKSMILMKDMGPVCKVFVQTGYVYYLSVKETRELPSMFN